MAYDIIQTDVDEEIKRRIDENLEVTELIIKESKLSDRQKLFAHFYLRCLNPKMAAQQAGWDAQTASQQGLIALNNPAVRSYINELLRLSGMQASEAIKVLSDHARGTIEHFISIDESGTPRIDLSTAQAKDNLKLIKKLTQTTTTRTDRDGNVTEKSTVSIEMYDAQTAAALIGKSAGAFDSKSSNQIDGELSQAKTVYIVAPALPVAQEE